jgi:microcystin degradation protein MlrC
VLIGYDTLPHVDMAERGREAASVIARLLRSGERPRKAFRKLPLLTVPQMQATDESLMRDIMAECFAIERDPGILLASVVPGFPYTDVPHLGAAALAYGDAADAAVQGIADALWSRRELFRPHLLSPEDAVARAMRAPRGPFILSEPADNVGGGAPGDSTYIVQTLMAAKAAGASVVLWDPAAAAIAAQCGVGRHCRVTVGGRTHPLHGRPTEIEGKVGFAGHVRYRRDASYMTGQSVDLGLVARIDVGGVRVVLTTERAMPMDKMHLRCAGIEPEWERMISVKCASAWRGAFGDIAADQCYVDTPGICSSNVDRMPYTRLGNPMYPLSGG